LANTAESFTPPAWSCDYGGEQDVNAENGFNRFLLRDGQDNDDHHFDHAQHAHSDHDHSDHDHSHHFDPSNTEKALTDL
jgi:hypothetical protein